MAVHMEPLKSRVHKRTGFGCKHRTADHRIVVFRPPVNAAIGHIAVCEVVAFRQQAARRFIDHGSQRCNVVSPTALMGSIRTHSRRRIFRLVPLR